MRLLAVASLTLLAACGSSGTVQGPSTQPATSTTAQSTATTVQSTATTEAGAGGTAIVNTWVGPPVDPTALPIGNDHVTTTAASVGDLFVCDAGDPNGGGAFAVGPWIDEAAGTWDLTAKVAVLGAVEWPMAMYSESVDGDKRVIASNGLPVGLVTGVFPIAADDPAYSYDRNPNSIAEGHIALSLPATPAVAATPTCLPKGTIGVLRNGVALFASVDALNRDAAAYETQDDCDGHPERSGSYHYHTVPSCVISSSVGPSTVVGFALDGFPIVVERDPAGDLPTNADLDDCHGRTSPIEIDGAVVEMYHYSATLEFPYFIGCYRGTPS